MLINLTELFAREGKRKEYTPELECRQFQIPGSLCQVEDQKPVTLYIQNMGDRKLELKGEAKFSLLIPV